MPKQEQKYQFKIATHKHYRADGTLVRGQMPFVPTPAEMEAFADQLVPATMVTDEPAEAPASNNGGGFDVSKATVDDVVAAVTAERISAEEALKIEKANKNRATLIAALEAMIG